MKKKSKLKKIVKNKINVESSTDEEAEIDYIQNIYDDDKDLFYLSKQKENKDEEVLACERNTRKKPMERENMKFLLPIKENGKIVPRYQRIAEQVLSNIDDNQKEEQSAFFQIDKPIKSIDLTKKFDDVFQFKNYLASLANSIIENPDEQVLKLNKFLNLLKQSENILKDDNENQRAILFIIASLTEIFKDVIPGYSIRPPTEIEKEQLATKETRKLRSFEENILMLYKKYISIITAISRTKINMSNNALNLIIIATCRELLLSKPHFNFTGEIIKLLVPFLNYPNDEVALMASDAVQNIFLADGSGSLSLEVVRIINQLVKRKDYKVRREVIDVFLYLRIEEINKPYKEEGRYTNESAKHSKTNKKLPSRNDLKKAKAMDRLNKDLEKTEAIQTTDSKARNDSALATYIFTIYFKVLRDSGDPRRSSTAHTAQTRRLLSAVLRGLSTFAHLINVEFFHDLISSLYHLATSHKTGRVDKLHAIAAAFSILSGQLRVGFNIDLSRFYRLFYDVLSPFDPEESTPVLGENGEESQSSREKWAQICPVLYTLEECLLVAKCVDVALLKRHKHLSPSRVSAFVKRLALLSLSAVDTNSFDTDTIPAGKLSTGVIYHCLVQKLLKTFPGTLHLFETERAGSDGFYMMTVRDPDFCQAQNASLWECYALKLHSDPSFRGFVKDLFKQSKDSNSDLYNTHVERVYQTILRRTNKLGLRMTNHVNDGESFVDGLFGSLGNGQSGESASKKRKSGSYPKSRLNHLIRTYNKRFKSYL